MSGHSKWATIKRKKGAADAKRGQVFTRLTREIVLAAREGGGDADSNFRLRLAIDRARAQNMPKENIERAVKRGTGADKDGAAFEEVTYEGYAPHGVALMIECVTENRNRTVAEIRHLLTRSGGNMGEAGSVGWQFTRQAYFAIPSKGINFDDVFMMAAEGGAEAVTEEDGVIEITAPVEASKPSATSSALRTCILKKQGCAWLLTRKWNWATMRPCRSCAASRRLRNWTMCRTSTRTCAFLMR
jgi:YebC/PmpR family DNA-binding regulatory protein